MADLAVTELSKTLRDAIAKLETSDKLETVGIVTRVGDGVAWVHGLADAGYSEVLQIETAHSGVVEAFALNLMEDEIGAVLLGSDQGVAAGDRVTLKGEILSVPVGTELLGRVVNPLGEALDGGPAIKSTERLPVEREAVGVMGRKHVHEPLMTGIMAIDAMFPIGRGQRELIIGDRQTGKTAIAVDTMINQAKQQSGVVNVYVAVGQKLSKVARLVETLKREGVMDQTIVVATGPSDPASLLYLAPYAGTAMGEYFRDKGEHALMIYDDLTKHAVAYRQMSLLLRRPPGREAFPGDVFYLHSRLLERACRRNKEHGGGSITALPIIETQAGDISAYIPTNVISITDGQVFLETDLFFKGVRPAINVGNSVSRVGSSAQIKAMKKVAGTLKLDLAQFRELEAFSQFGSDLDEGTKKQLNRGRRAVELLKQAQYAPQKTEEQVISLYALTRGYMDTIPVEKLRAFESGLVDYVKINCKQFIEDIQKEKMWSDASEAALKITIEEFTKSFLV